MIDDSILGHISNDLGLKDTNERTMSGGFLSFNPKRIRFPFLNIYNEDWIWLFLHSNEEKYLQSEFVIQKYSDPYFGYENKILFQEYGEIIISGILLAKEKESFDLLTLKLFWESVIGERKAYLFKLYELTKISKRKDLTAMIKWLLQNYSQYGSCYFSEFFNDYLNVKQKFENVYN